MLTRLRRATLILVSTSAVLVAALLALTLATFLTISPFAKSALASTVAAMVTRFCEPSVSLSHLMTTLFPVLV